MDRSRTVGLVGLGLIGGSIAHALRRKNGKYLIIAWNRAQEPTQKAFDDGVIDVMASSDFHEFGDCDIVFLCVPVFAMKDMAVRLAPILNPDCILTDVGSTKGDVTAIMDEAGLGGRFIGGHPLAGSEQSGYSVAKANLFENAYYVVTTNDSIKKEYKDFLNEIISDIGAISLEMSAGEHDRVAAAISHVPHVIASLLVNLVKKLDGPQQHMKTVAAGGFKDITRIASSSPELWTGICLSNRDTVIETITELRKILDDFSSNLMGRNVENLNAYFGSARIYRNSFSDMQKSIIQKDFDIIVDVEDKPGIIAVIATALAENKINIKNIGIINSRENDEGALEIRFENAESMEKGIKTLTNLGYTAKART